jgi:ABC-type Fe3+/spermidine/putrescine transport system ATPase subunit
LVLLHEGRIVQSGSPDEVYNHPYSAWVAAFLGQTNLIPGEVTASEPCTVRTDLGVFHAVPARGGAPQVGEQVTLLLRPDEAQLVDPAEGKANLCGRVTDVVFKGDGYRMDLEVPSKSGELKRTLTFQVKRPPAVGSMAALEIPAQSVLAFQEAAAWTG